jgi:hypothetical protein
MNGQWWEIWDLLDDTNTASCVDWLAKTTEIPGLSAPRLSSKQVPLGYNTGSLLLRWVCTIVLINLYFIHFLLPVTLIQLQTFLLTSVSGAIWLNVDKFDWSICTAVTALHRNWRTVRCVEILPKLRRSVMQKQISHKVLRHVYLVVVVQNLLFTRLMSNKIRNVYSLEYTKIPKVFFMPHDGLWRQKGNQGKCNSGVKGNNCIQGHCYNNMIRCCKNVNRRHCCNTVFQSPCCSNVV